MICGLGKLADDSESGHLGFVDLSFYDDVVGEMEQAAAALHDFEAAPTYSAINDQADEGKQQALYSTQNIDIRRYRAWVGSRSLHIS